MFGRKTVRLIYEERRVAERQAEFAVVLAHNMAAKWVRRRQATHVRRAWKRLRREWNLRRWVKRYKEQ